MYAKYCPQKIHEIQHEVVPYLKRNKPYKISSKLLEEIANDFKTKSYLATNILLLTVVESLVRQLARFVYLKQNPGKSQDEAIAYINKFMSLESLIKKAEWKEDLSITISEAYALTKYIDDPSLNKILPIVKTNKSLTDRINSELMTLKPDFELLVDTPKNEGLRKKIQSELDRIRKLSQGLIPSMDYEIKICLRTRLQFLLRRFKDDRNSIIHGNYDRFNEGWKSYIYLSAVIKIVDLIKEYESIYKT